MANSAVVGILRVLLTADKAEFEKGFKDAAKFAKSFSKDLGTMGRQASDAGRTMTAAITLPLLGIATAAAKASIDFQSSFAGVRKTVKATDAEFAVMAQSLRDLAKTIPVNVNELNRLAEAAGAMGIPKDAIADFSRVMALLGVTTNVTSEQAAESIGKIQNIFGAAGKDTEKFASTLVALGNDGASTESQILEMATRIAGAGNTIGMTQGQVLGFASALASVGLEAEAGGTAISKVFINMASAVSAGGKELDQFAKVAGMSADQFTQKFKTDASGAVLAFIEGLGRIKSSGGDLIGTLAEMDIKEVRLRDTLLRVAGAGDLVAGALRTQGENWKVNGALIVEANERFKTTESQMGLLWNRVKDVGIALGNALLPAINSSIGLLNLLLPLVDALAKGFGSLPGPVQLTVVGFLGLVAAVGPAVFVFGQMLLGAKTLITPLVLLGNTIPVLTARIWLMEASAKALSSTLGQGVLVAAVLGAMVAFDKLEKSTRDSLQAVKDGNATWSDLPSLLANAVSRGINPVGAAMRDLLDIWKRFPGEVAVFKDAVVRLSQQLYEGVKTWLVDRFGGIVESLRAKVEAVKGYFKDLYDKVVGSSYVPDLVEGVIREFNRLQGGMVTPSLVMTEQTGNAFGGLKDRVLGDFLQMKDGVLNTLGNMLGGVTGWKDGFLDIFRSLKQGISDIITDILNDLTGRFMKGLMGMLSGKGGMAQAFSGFLPGLFGGGGNATAGMILGNGGAPVIGIPGAAAGTPWWSTAAGGGAIGATAGAVAGWQVGTRTGDRGAGIGAGAGVGAGVGFALGGPIGALIGALVGTGAGWIGAKRANIRANDDRDAFIGQFGPSGTGQGSGFMNLAGELTAAGQGAGGGQLFQDLINANDPKEFAEAMEKVVAVLVEYRAKTEAATVAESAHKTEIDKVTASHEARIGVLDQERKALDDAEADLNRREAPEKHIGTVEKRERAKIAKAKELNDKARADEQAAFQKMLADLAAAAVAGGVEVGRGFDDGVTGGFDRILDGARTFRDRFNEIMATVDGVPWRPSTPQVPNTPPIPMESGGFGRVTRPTTFLAGEAGPEEFAFSGAGKTFSGTSVGGSRVTIGTVYLNGIPDERQKRELTEYVATHLDEVVNNGGVARDRMGRLVNGLVTA